MTRADLTDVSTHRLTAACDLWNSVPAAQITGPLTPYPYMCRLGVWQPERSASANMGYKYELSGNKGIRAIRVSRLQAHPAGL